MQSGLVVGNRKLEASLTTAKMLDVRNNLLRANTASMLKVNYIRYGSCLRKIGHIAAHIVAIVGQQIEQHIIHKIID